MGLIESWGTGLRRIKSLAEDFNLPPPEFIDSSIAFRVNLFRKTALNDEHQTGSKTSEELRRNFGITSEKTRNSFGITSEKTRNSFGITSEKTRNGFGETSEKLRRYYRKITAILLKYHRKI
jgi:predicted HTH transcriptional regulator